jgi:hypothetical protein
MGYTLGSREREAAVVAEAVWRLRAEALTSRS